MPTYSYSCQECENSFEIQQSITEDSLTVCPNCAGVLKKNYAPIGVTFNGSGFYRTDSRKSGGSSSGGANKASSN